MNLARQMQKQILTIAKEDAEKYNRLMQCESIDYAANNIARYSTVCCWGISFGDGYEADLKVCSSDWNTPLWCEVVLFKDGSEIGCTDVFDDLTGEWVLVAQGKTFVLSVVAGEEE